MNNGTLYLVATPIGNLSEISSRALDTLNNVDIIACEDTRNSRKLLSHFDIHQKLVAYHKYNENSESTNLINELKEGKNIAIISDAGYPLISDPGYVIVQKAIEEDINVVTISGPNAGLNALVTSGLDNTHYLFYGFLNSKQSSAKKELEELKNLPYTLIFYEAPHRINETLKICLEVLGDRKAVVARELTKIHETFYRDKLSNLVNLGDLKGEIVLLIEGKDTSIKEEVDINVVRNELKELVNSGLKLKKACEIIGEKYNLSKSNLYNDFIKNK